MKNIWIEDKLLKVRTKDDKIGEDFDNRTVIVRGIANDLKNKDIVTHFSEFGAIVGVEMPTFNKKLQDLSYEKAKADPFTAERKKKHDLAY